MRRLDRNDIEMVNNSFFQAWLQDFLNPLGKAKLTELLVLNKIPNYLTRRGPYHRCIDDARRNPYLKDFRKWIVEQSIGSSLKEIRDMKKQVESAIKESEDEIFLDQLNPKNKYYSIGKTLLDTGLDLSIPCSSVVRNLAEAACNDYEMKQRRWQGFIISLRKMQLN